MKLIDKKNYEKIIQSKHLVIDFTADWCGPCKMFGPIFAEAAKEVKNITFAKLDVDKLQELAKSHKVASIPTLIVFKNGEETKRYSGFMSKDDFIEFLK